MIGSFESIIQSNNEKRSTHVNRLKNPLRRRTTKEISKGIQLDSWINPWNVHEENNLWLMRMSFSQNETNVSWSKDYLSGKKKSFSFFFLIGKVLYYLSSINWPLLWSNYCLMNIIIEWQFPLHIDLFLLVILKINMIDRNKEKRKEVLI